MFNLPTTTNVYRVIPKNAFDAYTNTKQKKMLSTLVAKIIWQNKLSPETTNLNALEIKEIQIFRIELKSKQEIQLVLEIIDKAIPYPIIFIVAFEEQVYLSTSVKHPHPLNENNAVVDWAFKTTWFPKSENQHQLLLHKNLDATYQDFCNQLSILPERKGKSLNELVQYNKQIDTLQKEIAKLKSEIAKCEQFNKKVELNLQLKEVEKQLTTNLNMK
jgi:hypothetical protein